MQSNNYQSAFYLQLAMKGQERISDHVNSMLTKQSETILHIS